MANPFLQMGKLRLSEFQQVFQDDSRGEWQSWDLKIKLKSIVPASLPNEQIFTEHQLHKCLERPVVVKGHRAFSPSLTG